MPFRPGRYEKLPSSSNEPILERFEPRQHAMKPLQICCMMFSYIKIFSRILTFIELCFSRKTKFVKFQLTVEGLCLGPIAISGFVKVTQLFLIAQNHRVEKCSYQDASQCRWEPFPQTLLDEVCP